jgi:SAM-dependent methyltransferase
VDGLDVVELGCGTAYWSAWLARRGARPVGLDNSSRQLATARLFQEEFDLRFPLVHADAERAPFRDESFDLAFSEYGAAIWCDPFRWIPEAARMLRPGGWLIFLGGHPLLLLCYPKDDDEAPADFQLHRDFFGMHRTEWHDKDGKVDSVEFRLPHGEMIRLLRSSGFEIEDLVEIRVPDGATTTHDDVAPLQWVKRYPPEQIWKARKR